MNPETMNHPHLLTYGNKETIVLHCVGCGKFKDKKSKSTKCTVCLFGMSHEEAVKHGFIQS
jgi:hypothetical protein